MLYIDPKAAIEATAVEVERIGERQRFTTRLLAERAREPSVEKTLPERPTYRPAVTPHQPTRRRTIRCN